MLREDLYNIMYRCVTHCMCATHIHSGSVKDARLLLLAVRVADVLHLFRDGASMAVHRLPRLRPRGPINICSVPNTQMLVMISLAACRVL